MILATAIGWSLQQFAGVPNALVPAVLVGLFAAMLVPVSGGCALPPRTSRE